MTYKDSLLDRYDAVAALSARGVGGERLNAQAIRVDMEQRYPGIARQARLRTPQEDFDPFKGNGNGSHPVEPEANSAWASLADSALRWSFSVMNAEGIREYAHTFAEVRAKWLASEKFQVAAKIPEQDLNRLQYYLTDQQKAVFAEEVGLRVAQAILTQLYPEED